MDVAYVKTREIGKYFNRTRIKIQNGIYTIGISDKTNDKKIKRIVHKLKKKLHKNGVSNIILSEFLEKKLEIKGTINVLNGGILYQYLIYDIIEYIARLQNSKLENLEISFLTSQNCDIVKENILLIAKKIKQLNVITNSIQKFKIIEEYLDKELGIMIKVSNNKKKGANKSNIIVNFDFAQELINQYNIPNNCIIINMVKNANITIKKFNGFNIIGYKIAIPQEYMMENFRNEVIYESLIKGNFNNVRNMFKKDDVKITGLVGNNGIIAIQEFNK